MKKETDLRDSRGRSKDHNDLGGGEILGEFWVGAMRKEESSRMMARFGLNKWLNYQFSQKRVT